MADDAERMLSFPTPMQWPSFLPLDTFRHMGPSHAECRSWVSKSLGQKQVLETGPRQYEERINKTPSV
jgi:hypothetical protein